MPDVGSAIIARLEAARGWWAAVDGRVDWTVSQPDTPFPRVVLTIVSRGRPDHFDGPDLAEARLQLDVYSIKSADEASEIAEAAIDVLQPEASAGGIYFRRCPDVDGPTDSGDQTDTLYVYRARTDFALLFSDERV